MAAQERLSGGGGGWFLGPNLSDGLGGLVSRDSSLVMITGIMIPMAPLCTPFTMIVGTLPASSFISLNAFAPFECW